MQTTERPDSDWSEVIDELEAIRQAWQALADGEDVEIVGVPSLPTDEPPEELHDRLRSILDEFRRLEGDLAIALEDTRTSLLDLRAASVASDRYLKN